MIQAEPLKLVAFDTEDLAVLSAHVQDADVQPANMAYLAAQQRFALVLERYDWQAALSGLHERVETGLHFDHVSAVSSQNIVRDSTTALTLLSITFKEAQAPSGTITLTFAKNGAIRLEVECIDAQLRDMMRRWSVERAPADRALDKGETEFGN